MNSRLWGVAATIFCTAAVVGAAKAAGEAEPQIPQLMSIDRPWVAPIGDRAVFLSPPSGIGPVTYDHEHPITTVSPNAQGIPSQNIVFIADLKNPNLKPWVVESLRKTNELTLSGKLHYTSRSSCMPAGVPQFLLYAAGAESLYIIQTPKEVVMIHQADNQTRHIYLNASHPARPAHSWYGDSVGHYENGELVVDTIGFNDRSFLDDRYDVPHTADLHVTERYRMIDDGKGLEVTFTVEDPGAFYAPWSAVVRYQHARQPAILFEEPCSENNGEDISGFPAPAAKTPDF